MRFRAIVDSVFCKIMDRDLKTGQHRNPTNLSQYFTTAYFHEPDELKGEVREAGFKTEGLWAVESFGWLLPDFNHRWSNKIFQDLILSSIRKVESESALLGVSAHVMCVGRK